MFQIDFSLSGSFEDFVAAEVNALHRAVDRGVAAAAEAVREELLAQLVGSAPLVALNELFGVQIYSTEGTATQNSSMTPRSTYAAEAPDAVWD